MLIVYPGLHSLGWTPIAYMVELAARVFEAEVLQLDDKSGLGRLKQIMSLGPRRQGEETCLLICPSSATTLALLDVPHWRKRFRKVVVWVIDSFWHERIPRFWRKSNAVDLFYVTNFEDVEPWRARVRADVEWLPLGAETKELGSLDMQRDIDLLRVGRQPGPWDNDEDNEQLFRATGLHYVGRPPSGETTKATMELLATYRSRSKFTLAFSNTAAPAGYTHPTRAYLTNRWLDALACGNVIAGISPDAAATRELLWPEALLEFDSIDRESGMQTLQQAVQEWTPEVARINRMRALEKLDWRWRFQMMADALDVDAPVLRDELKQLKVLVAQLKSGQAVPLWSTQPHNVAESEESDTHTAR